MSSALALKTKEEDKGLVMNHGFVFRDLSSFIQVLNKKS